MVTEPERIADEDLARIVAFLDGEMMGDEAHDFKLRLMGEPALRRALLEFEEAETLLQKGVGRGARSSAGEEVAMDQPTASSVEAVLQPRPARILRMPVLLPAAAALVLLLGLWQVFGGDANQPGFDMAPLATTATLEQYHDQLGLPPRQRRQILRAQEETPPDYWSDEEYLAGVAAKEQEQREAWLKNRQDSAVPVGSAENPLRVPSGYLTLQLHLEEEASPVVLLVRSTGEVSLLYPSEEYPANGDRGSARLSAGVVHCLPRPTLRFKSDLQGSRRIEPALPEIHDHVVRVRVRLWVSEEDLPPREVWAHEE